MPDITLTDAQIISRGDSLLEPFDADRVKGVAYDIRVGSRIRMSSQEPNARAQWLALGRDRGNEQVELPPGANCLIESREIIKMPMNMKGRLSLRSAYAQRLLFFAGGLIDPGYNDHLLLPVTNLSDQNIKLAFEEPLVSVEFVLLETNAERAKASTAGPPEERSIVLNRVRLSENVKAHSDSIRDIEKRLRANEIRLDASSTILDIVVLGAIAAAAVTVVTRAGDIPSPFDSISVAVGIIFGFVSLALLLRALFARR